MNMGNLLRSAHAFGAKFFFTIGAHPRAFEAKSDTSKAVHHVPVYHWANADEIILPFRCKLVGVELIEGATDLPSFRHPLHAAYVLGPELGVLSEGDPLTLRPCYQNSDGFLHQRRDGRCDCHVAHRPRSLGSFPDRMEAPAPHLRPPTGKLSQDQ